MQRRLDELGRIVLPKEIRNQIGLGDYEAVTINVEKNRIVLEKTEKGCYLCGSLENLADVGSISFCANCRAQIGGLENGNKVLAK